MLGETRGGLGAWVIDQSRLWWSGTFDAGCARLDVPDRGGTGGVDLRLAFHGVAPQLHLGTQHDISSRVSTAPGMLRLSFVPRAPSPPPSARHAIMQRASLQPPTSNLLPPTSVGAKVPACYPLKLPPPPPPPLLPSFLSSPLASAPLPPRRACGATSPPPPRLLLPDSPKPPGKPA